MRRVRRATYSTAIGSAFAEPYADRKGPIDIALVNSALSEIATFRSSGDLYVMPGGKTIISTREGAGEDNIYLEIKTSRMFRVEPKLREALDGFSARLRSRRGARHMRYLFTEEKVHDGGFVVSER